MPTPLPGTDPTSADHRYDSPATTTPDPGHQVRWPTSLLEADPNAASLAFADSIHGYAKRLAPAARARFVMALDSALYSMQGEAAIAASEDSGDGLHPKHRLTRYHEFFVVRVRRGERVLDLGCGVGALAHSLASRAGAIVTGIDWSEKNLIRATASRAAASRATDFGCSEPKSVPAANNASSAAQPPSFFLGDITIHRVPGSFDAIILSNVLEHLQGRPQLLSLWQAWYNPSRFLIRVPAFDRDWRVPYKAELGVESRLDLTHEIEYTREALFAELAGAGLRVHELHVVWGEYWVQAAA